MKVLHLDLGPEMRGGQKQVLYLLDYFSSDPEIISYLGFLEGSPLEEAKPAEVRAIALPSRLELDFRNWIKLLFFLRQEGIDLVHTHEPRAASLAAGLRILRALPSRLLHTRRVSYPLRNRWSRAKYARGDCVTCVSREIYEILLREGLDKGQLEIVPSAIDVASYITSERQSAECLYLGIIGALTPQKGHSFLFRALCGLSDMHFYLYVAGKGPLFSELVNEVRDLGLQDRVEFCGYVPSRELLPGLDMLIVPSMDGEGSSAVIKESWASGVPVLVSDLPSNTELVRHGYNGMVFSRQNPQSLTDQLREVVRDRELGDRLVLNAEHEVRDYDIPVMARAYKEIYKKLVSAG